MQEYVTTKNLSTPICLDMIFYVLHMKLQYIVTPCSAPEYRKYDICQPFITGMCWDMSCIHSHPQSHIASHCITPGDVHFSLGLRVQMVNANAVQVSSVLVNATLTSL